MKTCSSARPRNNARDARVVLLLVAITAIFPVGTPVHAGPGPTETAISSTRAGTWPTSPVIIKEFAPPDPDWLPGHRGLDLAAGTDGLVRAPRAGTVIWRGKVAGTAVLVLEHGAVRSTYQPVVSELSVGTPVVRGEVLGSLQGDSHCQVTCLHWGLKLADLYIDPRLLIRPPYPVLVPERQS